MGVLRLLMHANRHDYVALCVIFRQRRLTFLIGVRWVPGRTTAWNTVRNQPSGRGWRFRVHLASSFFRFSNALGLLGFSSSDFL